jgi:hypothetical protein
MPKRQRTEDQYGNIRVKLDAEAAEHHNHPYSEFDLYCRLGLKKTVIAKLMNMKATSTIETWQEQRSALLDGERRQG